MLRIRRCGRAVCVSYNPLMAKKEYQGPRHENLHASSELITDDEVAALELALELAWCAKTMLPEEQADFDGTDPSYSQCFVTAMVIAYLLGGQIAQGTIREDPENIHAWNILPDDSQHDFNRKQFPKGFHIDLVKTRSFQSLLESSNAIKNETSKRFLLLLDRVFEYLPEQLADKWYGKEYRAAFR